MTFLEKAKSDLKDEEFSGDGLPCKCPCKYGYEKEYSCSGVECKDCWNREMPNTDKSILLLIGENYESSVVKKIKEQEEKMVKDIVNECLNNTEPQVAITKDDLELEYSKGLNDAWELVKKIVLKAEKGGLNYNDFKNIFGVGDYVSVLEEFTPQEALAKLKAYEEAQKIEVGDVVKVEKGVEFIVTLISDDSHLFGITATGDTYTAIPIKHCKKTGKHIDIQSILEQIRE